MSGCDWRVNTVTITRQRLWKSGAVDGWVRMTPRQAATRCKASRFQDVPAIRDNEGYEVRIR